MDYHICYWISIWHSSHHAVKPTAFWCSEDGQVQQQLHSLLSIFFVDFPFLIIIREKTERKALNAMLLKFQVRMWGNVNIQANSLQSLLSIFYAIDNILVRMCYHAHNLFMFWVEPIDLSCCWNLIVKNYFRHYNSSVLYPKPFVCRKITSRVYLRKRG